MLNPAFRLNLQEYAWGGKLVWQELAWRKFTWLEFFWQKIDVAEIWIGGKIETHHLNRVFWFFYCTRLFTQYRCVYSHILKSTSWSIVKKKLHMKSYFEGLQGLRSLDQNELIMQSVGHRSSVPCFKVSYFSVWKLSVKIVWRNNWIKQSTECSHSL